jgi:esterase/lipase superfamily enzyme
VRIGLFALALSMLAGCAATTPHMIPTPVAYKHPSLDLVPVLPPDLRSTEVPVFYATTREPVTAGARGHYRDAQGDGVRLGVARVRLGEPGWTWDQLVASDFTDTLKNPRPGQVEGVREFGMLGTEGDSAAERAFIAQIDERIARSNNKELVFYVHGYRVFFDEVTVMMGSWSHYLGHGAIATFHWPTGQNFWNYLTDCPRAERYVPDIERTIALLAKSRATYINIIAYSCGSPLLGQALARLRARHPSENPEQLARRYRIANVIFAASDVDLKTFASELAPPIMDLSRQTIIYASRNDAALGFSSLLAATSRLGRPDIKELSVAELERLANDPRFQAIDVSDVRGVHEMGGMRGHGYWYANDWIATDVALALRYPIVPAKRCLVSAGKRNLWKFPDDYPDCIAERLIAAYPQVRRTSPRVGLEKSR